MALVLCNAFAAIFRLGRLILAPHQQYVCHPVYTGDVT